MCIIFFIATSIICFRFHWIHNIVSDICVHTLDFQSARMLNNSVQWDSYLWMFSLYVSHHWICVICINLFAVCIDVIIAPVCYEIRTPEIDLKICEYMDIVMRITFQYSNKCTSVIITKWSHNGTFYVPLFFFFPSISFDYLFIFFCSVFVVFICAHS